MKQTFPQMLLIEFKGTEIKMAGRPGQSQSLAKEKGEEENIWRRIILGQRRRKRIEKKIFEKLENIWRIRPTQSLGCI